MNFKSILFFAAAMTVASVAASAQTSDHSRVKFLSTGQPGVIKLVYGMPISDSETITLRFSNASGTLKTHEIKGGFEKGFLKKFDLHKVFNGPIWVEVSTKGMTAVYCITPEKDGAFAAHVERVAYYNQYYAVRN